MTSHPSPPSPRSRRYRGRTFAFAVLSVGLLGGSASLGGVGCGSDSGIVGGLCAPGYVDCNGHCVAVATDPTNCGVCGNVCASGSCIAGACAGADAAPARDAGGDATGHDAADASNASDGTVNDTSTIDVGGDAPNEVAAVDGGVDAGQPDGSTADATTGDGVAPGEAGEAGEAGDACTMPYTSVSNCGACGVACASGEVCSPTPVASAEAGLDADVDGQADVGPNLAVYSCVSMCPSPYMACSGTCVDESNDPSNCGACGKECPSGICVKGLCAGAASGHIVVIGHDYASANMLVSEDSLLANAVFLPTSNPLRVLSYEQYADPSQVANVKGILKKAAQFSGRTVTLKVENDYTALGADLAAPSYDVVLVYDQAHAPQGTLATVGAAWQAPLGAYVVGGGDVVVLDGASGAHPEMATFLTSSGLLQTSGETPIASGTQLLVVASGDAVGNFVVTPYAAQTDTVSFLTSEPNGGNVTYVVDELSGGGLVPVVIHKTSP